MGSHKVMICTVVLHIPIQGVVVGLTRKLAPCEQLIHFYSNIWRAAVEWI